ncbi:MAG TPA: hypothetical protein VNO82_03540 [Solirubrobacteraceae bacterium]|nr:hypothetical protein [Solirubrobacteraceae bacterium]
MRLVAATVLALVLLPGTALAQDPTMRVQPRSLFPGERTLVSGSAGGCTPGNDVILMSRAFPGTREFAGVPAVFTPVRADGTYRARIRIPRRRDPGSYTITARCGGGNLGLTRRLRVRRPLAAYCSQTGDLCYGRIAAPLRLRITLAAEFFTRYRLCVRGPDLEVVCRRARVREVDGLFQSTVRWRTRFPDRGPGTYRARWFPGASGGSPLGPPIVFFR